LVVEETLEQNYSPNHYEKSINSTFVRCGEDVCEA